MITFLRKPLPTSLRYQGDAQRLLTLALLLTGLSSVAVGLATLIQGLEISLLLPLAVIGLLLGWRLAVSSWSGWWAGLLVVVVGVMTVTGWVGRLGGPLLAWLGLSLNYVWDWSWSSSLTFPLPTQVGTQLQVLLNRLFEWIVGLVVGAPIYDPVAVALAWSLAVWLAAAWAGWVVRRCDHPLLAILPAGVLLVITQAYVGGNFAFLLLLVAVTWLLLAQVSQATRERRWQVQGIDFSLEIRTDLAMVVIFISVSLMTLASMSPSLSWQQIAEAAQQLIWGQPIAAGPVASSLGLKPPPGQPTAFDKVRRAGLPRQHLLGSGPELSQQVVMTIKPHAPPSNYRWRSLTYDRYTGQGWLTGKTETIAYNAGETAAPQTNGQTFEVFAQRTSKVLIRQEVQTVGDLGGLVYAVGTLQAVDQDYSVAWRTNADAFGATLESTVYQADSLLSQVSEAQLQAAGRVYPAWVRRRYLALPAALPERVLTLARDLTATEPTPYDRAKAIERYLRTIPYNLDIPAPPLNRDVVDYFLFDLRQGYCDYYASAMVVLARAAGLPARLVVGYAGGSYDAAAQQYLVTEAQAHSWPEIYFPEYGWIEFEPTSSQPLLERPRQTQAISLPAAGTSLPPLSPPAVTVTSATWGWGLVAALAAVVLTGLTWSVADTWRLRHLPPDAMVNRLYGRLLRAGSRLIGPAEAGDTPYEFSLALGDSLNRLAAQPRWHKWLAPADAEISQLTALYIRTAYSPHPPTPAEGSQALQSWQRLRWRLWLAWAIRFFQSVRPKKIA